MQETQSTSFDIDVPGIRIHFLADSDSSAGAHTAFSYMLGPHKQGATAHYHHRMTETFHVMEGRLTLLVGNQWRVVEAGETVTILPGTVHGFRNDSDQRVTFFAFATPAGIERLLGEMVRLAGSSPEWPPQDLTPIVALGARHDTFYL